MAGYWVQLPRFFFQINSERQNSIKSCHIIRTIRPSSVRVYFAFTNRYRRAEIELINNLFDDYFKIPFNQTDRQRALNRPHCRRDHSSLSVILKHFAFLHSLPLTIGPLLCLHSADVEAQALAEGGPQPKHISRVFFPFFRRIKIMAEMENVRILNTCAPAASNPSCRFTDANSPATSIARHFKSLAGDAKVKEKKLKMPKTNQIIERLHNKIIKCASVCRWRTLYVIACYNDCDGVYIFIFVFFLLVFVCVGSHSHGSSLRVFK